GAGLAGMAIDPVLGVFAALFVAISPGHLQYSQFAHTDQHVAESCWGFLALACFLWSSKPQRTQREQSYLYEILCGLFSTCALLTWQGGIFWAPLFAAAIIFECFKDSPSARLLKGLFVLGIPALLCALA